MGIEASRVPCPKELLRPKHVMYTVTNQIKNFGPNRPTHCTRITITTINKLLSTMNSDPLTQIVFLLHLQLSACANGGIFML